MNRQSSRTTVLVVLFNSDLDLLRECVSSALNALGQAGDAGEVLLFDNGSAVTVDLWQDDPRVRYVRSNENLGFGRAVNAAMAHISSESIILLNPDASLSTVSLEAFITASERERRALFMGWMVKDGRLQVDAYLSWTFSTSRLLRRRAYERYLENSTHLDLVPVEKVCGGALFGQTSLLRELGPFDDRFFLYGEDADLSARAKDAGIALWAVPGARVNHVGAASQESFGSLVEMARADASIRFAAYHHQLLTSYVQRLELLAVTVAGLLLPKSSSASRSARLSRIRVLSKWGLRKDRRRFSPDEE